MATLKRNTAPTLLENTHHPLAGRRIVAVRGSGTNVAIVLDDGSLIVASRDEECNGPGVLFHRDRFSTDIVLARGE